LENTMFTIGLTGGIGTGKSAVAKVLVDLGAPVIDADEVGHAVYRPGETAHRELVTAFGGEILASDGTIDRKRLGALVFSDPRALRRLNAIVHPKIFERLRAMVAAMREQGERRPIIVEAAVLIEAGWEGLCREIWLVTASPERVTTRLERDRGLQAEEIRRRIAAQLPEQEKRKYAAIIIENNGTLEQLREKVAALWMDALSRAAG
jgi:dephospho-CoA kinase